MSLVQTDSFVEMLRLLLSNGAAHEAHINE